jgi:hypothetical protein
MAGSRVDGSESRRISVSPSGTEIAGVDVRVRQLLPKHRRARRTSTGDSQFRMVTVDPFIG